jgi:hypothetical protein
MHPDLTLRCGLMETGRRPLARLFEAVIGRCAIFVGVAGLWECALRTVLLRNVLLAKGQKGSRHKRAYSKVCEPFCQSVSSDYYG